MKAGYDLTMLKMFTNYKSREEQAREEEEEAEEEEEEEEEARGRTAR